jgi:hypothetical protein
LLYSDCCYPSALSVIPPRNKKTLVLLCLCSLCLIAGATPRGETSACDDPPTVITSARVFDGDRVLPVATVVFQCAKILAVHKGTHLPEIPEDARVIDGRDKTVLPGLIDAHAHVFGRETLERSLDIGVTTVLDMGATREGYVASIKKEDGHESRKA